MAKHVKSPNRRGVNREKQKQPVGVNNLASMAPSGQWIKLDKEPTITQGCQRDADCPEDYICENKQCWYLYGEPRPR